jgi:hypothetical protein
MGGDDLERCIDPLSMRVAFPRVADEYRRHASTQGLQAGVQPRTLPAEITRRSLVSTLLRLDGMLSSRSFRGRIAAGEQAFRLFGLVGGQLQSMAERIAEVNRQGSAVIDYRIPAHRLTSIIDQAQTRKCVDEALEVGPTDPERRQVKAGSFSGPLRHALEERQLGAAAIAGNHQRTPRVFGPVLVSRDDLEAEDTLVPLGRLMAVGDEQFDVVDLIDSELAVHTFSKERIVTCEIGSSLQTG